MSEYFTSSIQFIPESLKTDELCKAAVLAGEGDQEVEREVQLVSDTMRCVNSYLTDRKDTIALSNVNDDWRKALEENVDTIWADEWAAFKAVNKDEPWFTETVYAIPYKDYPAAGGGQECAPAGGHPGELPPAP